MCVYITVYIYRYIHDIDIICAATERRQQGHLSFGSAAAAAAGRSGRADRVGSNRWSGGLLSDAQHLSRPPFRSQPPVGCWRVGLTRANFLAIIVLKLYVGTYK